MVGIREHGPRSMLPHITYLTTYLLKLCLIWRVRNRLQRHIRVESIPGLFTVHPYLYSRLKQCRVISTSRIYAPKVWDQFRCDKNVIAALRTKPALHPIATLGLDLVTGGFSGDAIRLLGNVAHRTVGGPSCLLAIPAVTMLGEDGYLRNLVANRPTCTPASN